jgi:hypothetical protein
MGVFLLSCGEVVTTEPEKIKKLIEQIAQDKFPEALGDTTAPAYDLKIENYSIFFNSGGYGCYGVEWENPSPILFEKLFERYTGALLCFEYVVPCQSLEDYFSSTWVKPEGEVDWGDSETFYKHHRLLLKEGDLSEEPDEGDFDVADIWHISCNRLEEVKEHLPHLYAAYMKAKQYGFDGWIQEFYLSNDTDTQLIDYNIACKLADLYSEEPDAVVEDCHKDMVEWLKQPDLDNLEDFELPENFPMFQTKPAF